MIRVLIADDHRLLRQGIQSLHSTASDLEIVGEASDGLQVVAMAKELTPDLILMDIEMPGMDGLAATRRIKDLYPNIKILVLSHHDSEEYFFKLLQAGASGYVVKDIAGTELVEGIRAVSKGLAYVSPAIAHALIQERRVRSDSESKELLSPREEEVFKLLAEGYSSNDVAKKLFISLKTAQKHQGRIMEKLGINNRTELVKYAIRKGIITLE